jgi:hypothetical protein
MLTTVDQLQPGGRCGPPGGSGVKVALVSAKGSPGVTTTVAGLAARWPQPHPVMVEADPAGGDLAARFGRTVERGIAGLALDGREPGSDLDPQRWLQALPCGGAALLAPPGIEASASLALLAGRAGRLLEMLARQHPAVLVDAGRWCAGSPADPLLAAADVLLVVARPTLEQLGQVEARADALRALAGDVRLLLVGQGPWPAREISAQLRLPVIDVLPEDRLGAGVLSGRSVPRRGWDSSGWTRLPLPRACRALATRLASPPASPTAPAAAPALAGPGAIDTAAAAMEGRSR